MTDINIRVFEDEGGIQVIVEKAGRIVNIISGFEDGSMSTADFIEAAQAGFIDADDYDPDNFSGLSIEEAAPGIESADLIADITGDSVTLYEENMGEAGRDLFAI